MRRGRAYASGGDDAEIDAGNIGESLERGRAQKERCRASCSGENVLLSPILEENEVVDDDGPFKLRQNNYVRPNFPPFQFKTLYATLSELCGISQFPNKTTLIGSK